MDATQDSTAPAPASDLPQDVLDLLQVMGQSLNMALLYGLTHKVCASSLDISYMVISKFMELHGPIHLSVEGELLLINGVSTDASPAAANFVKRLAGLNLLSLVIQSGFPRAEYLKFLTVLLTPPSKVDGQDGSALMESLGFDHMQAKSFSYRRVSHDEDVAANAPPVPTDTVSQPEPEPAPTGPDLNGIMSFLDDKGDAARAGGDIRSLASDPEKLADVILKTLEAHDIKAVPGNQEALLRLLTGYIQKIASQLLSDPSIKTQKGRKAIKRSVLMLEKSLAGRLKELAGEEIATAMSARLIEIAGDLDVDALATQFMKSRRAAGNAEAKLANLIGRFSNDPAQLEELHQHLIHEGLPPDDWEKLTGHPVGGNAEEAPDVQELIAETAKQLALLSKLADQKTRKIEEKLGSEDSPRQLSRKEVLEILAELTQEISQPLTIINGTVALIRSLRIGPLTDSQLEMLGMVAESGDRMAQLVDSLMSISGMPTALNPDQAILNAAYKRG
jgi:signal transduction histidine kinase